MAKTLIFALPLALYLIASFFLTTYYTGESAWRAQIFIFCLLSVAANIFVLYYHYTHPAHPKFLMLRWRKLCLRVHIISGSIELYAAILAYIYDSSALATLTALTALLCHIPTALFQAPIVFGAKAIMTPGYFFIIALHAFCAFHLLLNPTSTLWLTNTFLALNTYVWCRIIFFALQRLGLFRDSLYTVSITLAGFMTFPSIMGPLAPMLLLGFVLLHIGEFVWLRQPSDDEYRDFVREHARYTLIDAEAKALWKHDQRRAAGADVTVDPADQAHAKQVFDRLDQNHSGNLSAAEIKDILLEFKLPEEYAQAFVQRFGENGQFDFTRFYKKIWRIEALHNRLKQPLGPATQASEQEQADFIFDQIDIDQSGFLEAFELKMLLIEWGLPEKEVAAYFRRLDIDNDGRFSKQEFFERFRPLWRSCIYEIQRGRMRL